VIAREKLWRTYFFIAAGGVIVILFRFGGDRLAPFRRDGCSRCDFEWPLVDCQKVQYRAGRALHPNDRILETDLVEPDFSSDHDRLRSLLPDRTTLTGHYLTRKIEIGEAVTVADVRERPLFAAPFVDNDAVIVVATASNSPNLEAALHSGDEVTLTDVSAKVVAFGGDRVDRKVFCAISKADAPRLAMKPLPQVTAVGAPPPPQSVRTSR
jgi:hypothetical protein